MGLGDAYLTPAEYRVRVNSTDSSEDSVIQAGLDAASHFVDTRCRRKDGFNQSAAVETRIFNGNGRSCTYLTDGSSYSEIATTTGLIVKCDLNGDYDYGDSGETLTINTHFWVSPYNAQAGSDPRPYDALELIPTNSVVTTWPNQRRAIEVTAKFGWPQVPEAIKELVTAYTRYMRDIQESGITFQIQAIDQQIQESTEMSRMLRNIERQYAQPAAP